MNRVPTIRVFLLALICIAALPAFAQSAAPTGSVKDAYYNVRQYGATGDGKTLDSPAINKAIETCAGAGGGTVYLPPGTYLSGSIRLKSNIHLLLDMGATILDGYLPDGSYAFAGFTGLGVPGEQDRRRAVTDPERDRADVRVLRASVLCGGVLVPMRWHDRGRNRRAAGAGQPQHVRSRAPGRIGGAAPRRRRCSAGAGRAAQISRPLAN